jgi:hypothetical protein
VNSEFPRFVSLFTFDVILVFVDGFPEDVGYSSLTAPASSGNALVSTASPCTGINREQYDSSLSRQIICISRPFQVGLNHALPPLRDPYRLLHILLCPYIYPEVATAVYPETS